MQWRIVFCALVLSIGTGFAADGDIKKDSVLPHGIVSKEVKERTEAEKKRKAELIEKISKCQQTRPGGTENTSDNRTASVIPADNGGTPKKAGDGAALFTQYCASCHGDGKSPGAIKNRAGAAGRMAGGQMPPPEKPQPSKEEKDAIAAFLASK